MVDPVLTDDEWRDRLEKKLNALQPDVRLYDDYYAGKHRLSFATAKFKEAFGKLFEAFADNWCGLVVDAAVERLKIQGFRFGEDKADDDAWDIWQANRLDALSIMAHTEAVKTGCAYLCVGPPSGVDGAPLITVESPHQVVVEQDPTDRTRRLAALKKYKDSNGDLVSVLYLPDRIVEFRRRGSAEGAYTLGLWVPETTGQDWDVASTTSTGLGVVPVVPLENNPGLVGGGTSDLRPAIALNDAANKFFSDMIHASEFTSFPQRVLTGVELPRDPITGDVLPEVQLRAAVGRMWGFEAPDAKVYDLSAGDLSNYIAAIELAVQHMAAQTRTPPHYLLAQMVNLSGDALKTAETGLVARVRRKFIDFSDSWEETLRIAFRWRALDREAIGDIEGAVADEERADMLDAETIWADPESRDPSGLGDSLIKKQAIGVPWTALMEEAGYSPQQIARMAIEKAAEEAKAEQKAQQQQAQAQAAKAAAAPTNGATGGGTFNGGEPVAIAPAGDTVKVKGLPGP